MSDYSQLSDTDDDIDDDNYDLLPPPNRVQVTEPQVIKPITSNDTDELDLISTTLLDDTRRKNDAKIQASFTKSVKRIDHTKENVKKELKDDGVGGSFVKDGDEQLQMILLKGGERFFYYFNDLTDYAIEIKPVVKIGIDLEQELDTVDDKKVDEESQEPDNWLVSTDREVLQDHIDSLTEAEISSPIPHNISIMDLGTTSGITIKLVHRNPNADINLMKATIYIKYNLKYNNDDPMLVFNVFFKTLCDKNLVQYWYKDLLRFSEFFTPLYKKYPINIEDVINQWEVRVWGEEEKNDEIRNEMFYHILNILNNSPTPEILNITKQFIKFTNLNEMFDTPVNVNTVKNLHLQLRLLQYVLSDLGGHNKDIGKLTFKIEAMKKKYHKLMHDLSLGSKSSYTVDVDTEKVLRILHEDYYYLNYYYIKFKSYLSEFNNDL